VSAIRHARGRAVPRRPLTPSTSSIRRPRVRSASGRPRRRGRPLARSGAQLVVAVGALGTLGAGAAGAINAISAAGAGGSIATVTAPVTVTAQLAGSTHRAGATGGPWLFPGGPALQLPVDVRNPGDVRFTVRQLVPDATVFPIGCPLSAWSVRTPDALPTVSAGGSASVTVVISLLTQAPESCQGATVRFPLTVESVPT
jgi:hypothetical protein